MAAQYFAMHQNAKNSTVAMRTHRRCDVSSPMERGRNKSFRVRAAWQKYTRCTVQRNANNRAGTSTTKPCPLGTMEFLMDGGGAVNNPQDFLRAEWERYHSVTRPYTRTSALAPLPSIAPTPARSIPIACCVIPKAFFVAMKAAKNQRLPCNPLA